MKNSTPLRSFTAFAVCVSVLAFSLGTGCQGKAQSSSSTNWLKCQTDADCAVVAGAVCRSDSTCVDSSGRPIPASDSADGGKPGSGGAAGDPSSSGGRVLAGGTSAGGVTPSAGTGGATNTVAGAGGASAGALNVTGGEGGASAGGAAGNTAGVGGAEECPPGPPTANAACTTNGLVCQYAGSSIGIVATCNGSSWVIEQGGGDPSYVCPDARPAQGSACPPPPTPAFSALVCLFDCADKGCQTSGGPDCGALQADCVRDSQSGNWQWLYRPRAVQCPAASCEGKQSTATWSAPALDKTCLAASDCFVGRHTFNCCGSIRYVGYNLSERDSFDTYEQLCQDRALCDCASRSEVEDGTLLNKGATMAACVDGLCRAVCTAQDCHFTADCSASDECLQGTTCTWINPLSGANLCRKPDGTCGGC